MKTSLAFAVLLFSTSCAQAQHHMHCEGSFGSGGTQWSLGGGLGGATISGSEFYLRHEPPREFGVVTARNDGEYIPSTFMKYEDALELGRQQIAAAERQKKDVGALFRSEKSRAPTERTRK